MLFLLYFSGVSLPISKGGMNICSAVGQGPWCLKKSPLEETLRKLKYNCLKILSGLNTLPQIITFYMENWRVPTVYYDEIINQNSQICAIPCGIMQIIVGNFDFECPNVSILKTRANLSVQMSVFLKGEQITLIWCKQLSFPSELSLYLPT